MKIIKKLSNNDFIIIEGILSFIITELLVHIFQLENNICYLVIGIGILTFLIDYLRKNLKNNDKKETIITIVFDMIFSLAILVQTKINFTGKISQGSEENTFESFTSIDILKYLIIFILTFIVIEIIQIIIKKVRKEEIIQEKIELDQKIKYWCIYTSIIFIPYIIFFLIHYPGSVLADSFSSINQIVGSRALDNHFPIVYTFFVGIFMKIGQAINNYNIGVALYTITQITIISGGLGYFLVWLKGKNIKDIYILLVAIYFIGNAIFATYAITMWKDPLFCLFLFILMLRLYDVVESNGEILKKTSVMIQFIILNILISFFRNNGTYITLLIGLILLIKYWKNYKKFIIGNAVVAILIVFVQGPLYSKLKIKTPSEESFGILIQQIAYTMSVGGKIEEEDKQLLYEILPEEDWIDSYAPFLVDPIKWNSNFSSTTLGENKGEFIKIWLKTLSKNFLNYVKAYSLETYGFWSIETNCNYGFYDNYISENDYNIHKVNLIARATGINLEKIGGKTDFLGTGTLFWIVMIVVLSLIRNKESKYIIALLPGIILWLTVMIATPVAFSLRYMFVLAYALPFILILPMIKKERN